MTSKRRVATLLLTLACVDDWDGMDRDQFPATSTPPFIHATATGATLPTPPPTYTPIVSQNQGGKE